VPRQCVRGPTSGYVSEQACVCPRPTEVRTDRSGGGGQKAIDVTRRRSNVSRGAPGRINLEPGHRPPEGGPKVHG